MLVSEPHFAINNYRFCKNYIQAEERISCGSTSWKYPDSETGLTASEPCRRLQSFECSSNTSASTPLPSQDGCGGGEIVPSWSGPDTAAV